MNSNRKSQSGFSLVEVVIVMLVLGILSATVAPRYLEAITKYRVEAVSRRIVADLKLAQRESQRTSTAKFVTFDLIKNNYIMSGISDLDRPGKDYSFELGQSAYQVNMISVDFEGAKTLSFDIYGRPSAAGTVVVNSSNETQLIQVDADGNISRTSL